MSIPDEQARQIREALLAGRKIEAIKLYREQTGLGLMESKQAMEALEAELRASMPEAFAKPPSRGCFTAVVLLIAAVALVAAAVIR
jgi:hypothetical protein